MILHALEMSLSSTASCNNDSFRLAFFSSTVIMSLFSLVCLVVYNMEAT
jgi:hypothetical protein